jgi:polyisoprenoid-binding protein YceI
MIERKDATIEFTLDVNNTDNKLELIDIHMKLNDLFDIHNYPSISFKVKVKAISIFYKRHLTIKYYENN